MKFLTIVSFLIVTPSLFAKTTNCFDIGVEDSCKKIELTKNAYVTLKTGEKIDLKLEVKDMIIFNGDVESIITNSNNLVSKEDILKISLDRAAVSGTGVDGGGG
ncbi:MAG: hypothetical protein ACJAS4_002873 [Bacteriovoracaceae bacterium]